MKNNATSVGALFSVRWLHTVLNRDSRSIEPGPLRRQTRPAESVPPSSLLSRVSTAICSTATSRTNRIVEINSGSKFDGMSFGDDDDFSTGNLLLANVVYPSRESAV